MCLCPCVLRWQGWPWDMVFCIFWHISDSHKASHTQWWLWAGLPFWCNELSLTSHLLGIQQQFPKYLLVSHHHLDWVNHALHQLWTHHSQEFPSQQYPPGYLQHKNQHCFGKSVTDILVSQINLHPILNWPENHFHPHHIQSKASIHQIFQSPTAPHRSQKDPVPFPMQKLVVHLLGDPQQWFLYLASSFGKGMKTKVACSICQSDPVLYLIYSCLWLAVKKDSIGWHPSATFFQLFSFHQVNVQESPLYTTDLFDTFCLLSFGGHWS